MKMTWNTVDLIEWTQKQKEKERKKNKAPTTAEMIEHFKRNITQYKAFIKYFQRKMDEADDDELKYYYGAQCLNYTDKIKGQEELIKHYKSKEQ